VTPFAGVGVNLAMRDALDLARALIEASAAQTHTLSRLHSGNVSSDEHDPGNCESKRCDTAAAVGAYEKAMFERSEMYAKKTAKNLQGHFSRDGAEHMAGVLREHHEKEKGRA
jgi:hypothetical protein